MKPELPVMEHRAAPSRRKRVNRRSGLQFRCPRRYHARSANTPKPSPLGPPHHTTPHRKPVARLARLFRPWAPGLIPRQFRRDGAIFIHVPKCAGSALLDAWLGYQTGHVTAEQFRKEDAAFFAMAYVFTFVRNPFARFVSAYDHIQTDDLWDYLPDVKRLVDRHGGSVAEVAERLTPDSDLLTLPWFAPQHTFLEIHGRLAVNRVFKAETFVSDLEVIRAETPIRFRNLAPVNRRGDATISAAERLGATAVANLRRIYARDLTLFGYF